MMWLGFTTKHHDSRSSVFPKTPRSKTQYFRHRMHMCPLPSFWGYGMKRPSIDLSKSINISFSFRQSATHQVIVHRFCLREKISERVSCADARDESAPWFWRLRMLSHEISRRNSESGLSKWCCCKRLYENINIFSFTFSCQISHIILSVNK